MSLIISETHRLESSDLEDCHMLTEGTKLYHISYDERTNKYLCRNKIDLIITQELEQVVEAAKKELIYCGISL